MKRISLFHLYDCKYCDYARQAIKELTEENPEYKNIVIDMVEDNELPEIIENYDYMAVPTLFVGDEKIFEAALFMPYNTFKEGVKLAFDNALEDAELEAGDSDENIHDPCLRFQK